jgi:hypothetical protein
VAHSRKCGASSRGHSTCRRGYSLIRRQSGVVAVVVDEAGVKGAEFLFP